MIITLLEGLAKSSPQRAIEFIEDFAGFLGQKIKEEKYSSMEELWDAHERGETFLAKFEGTARRVKKGSGIFLYVYQSVLAEAAEKYARLFGELPEDIFKIVETYNYDPRKPYRPIGSPLHILVQGIRDAWAEKVIVGENGGIKILRLGYKKTRWVTPTKIDGFDTIITEEGKRFFKDIRELEFSLKKADFCYAIVPREF